MTAPQRTREREKSTGEPIQTRRTAVSSSHPPRNGRQHSEAEPPDLLPVTRKTWQHERTHETRALDQVSSPLPLLSSPYDSYKKQV